MKETSRFILPVAVLAFVVAGAIVGIAVDARSPRHVRSEILALNLFDNNVQTRISGHNFDCRRGENAALLRICTTVIARHRIDIKFRFSDPAQTNLLRCELEVDGRPHAFTVCRFAHSGQREPLPAMLVMDDLGLTGRELADYRDQFAIDQLGESTIIQMGLAYVTVLAVLVGLVISAWLPKPLVVKIGIGGAAFLTAWIPLLFGLMYWGFSSGFVD